MRIKWRHRSYRWIDNIIWIENMLVAPYTVRKFTFWQFLRGIVKRRHFWNYNQKVEIRWYWHFVSFYAILGGPKLQYGYINGAKSLLRCLKCFPRYFSGAISTKDYFCAHGDTFGNLRANGAIFLSLITLIRQQKSEKSRKLRFLMAPLWFTKHQNTTISLWKLKQGPYCKKIVFTHPYWS